MSFFQGNNIELIDRWKMRKNWATVFGGGRMTETGGELRTISKEEVNAENVYKGF